VTTIECVGTTQNIRQAEEAHACRRRTKTTEISVWNSTT